MNTDAGGVLVTDERGHVVRQASVDRIQPRWFPPLNAAVAAYRSHYDTLLHSVYVRGSVAVGRAVEGTSDIDTFAIVSGAGPDENGLWANEQAHAITRRWPFVSGVEICSYPLEAVHADGRLAAMIKTQSACMHGQDLTNAVGEFRPGFDLLFHAWDLPRDLIIARRALESERPDADTRSVCVWVMKRIVRCSFELVMAREGHYTRDLAACHSSFTKHYPARAAVLAEAVELAHCRSADPRRCIGVIDEFGEWLYSEICVEYGAARVAQLMADRMATSRPAG